MEPSELVDGSSSIATPSSADAAAKRRSVRILIADDHELIRTSLVCLLGRCGYSVVAEASNGQEAVTLWRQVQPDVSLLDLRMPVMDGIRAINAIRALDPRARTVVLSTFDGADLVSRALSAGAYAYVLKSISPHMLCACIDSVHSGRHYRASELAQRWEFHSTAASPPTHRELEVLNGVARGLSNKCIAQVLGIGQETVKGHLKSVFRKLDVSSRAHATSIAIRRGFVDV